MARRLTGVASALSRYAVTSKSHEGVSAADLARAGRVLSLTESEMAPDLGCGLGCAHRLRLRSQYIVNCRHGRGPRCKGMQSISVMPKPTDLCSAKCGYMIRRLMQLWLL